MQQQGHIISVEEKGFWVQPIVQTCAGCNGRCGVVFGSLLAKKTPLWVKDVGHSCQSGDRVVFSMDDRIFLSLMGKVCALPLFAFVVGALVGGYFGDILSLVTACSWGACTYLVMKKKVSSVCLQSVLSYCKVSAQDSG